MKELFQQKLIKIAAIAVLIIIAVVVISLSSGYFSTTPVILRTPLQSQYGKPLTINPKIEGEDVLLRFEIKLAKMKTKKMLLACRGGKSLQGTQGENFDIPLFADRACRLVLKTRFSNFKCASSQKNLSSSGWGKVTGRIKNQSVSAVYSLPGCLAAKESVAKADAAQARWMTFSNIWSMRGPLNKQELAAATQRNKQQKIDDTINQKQAEKDLKRIAEIEKRNKQ